MSRREGVGDEEVDNIVFLRRVEEGLLEGSRTVIECPNLCLESCVLFARLCFYLFKWYLRFGIVVVGWWLWAKVCETFWVVWHFNLFLQTGVLGGWGGKETFWERRDLGDCFTEKETEMKASLKREFILLLCLPCTVWSWGCKEAVGKLCHRLNILLFPGRRNYKSLLLLHFSTW